MKRVLLVLLMLMVALVGMGRSQSNTTQQSPLTLHVTTRLVQVNVIALDHHGHPISGLTGNDFQVFDNGKQQDIIVFRMESNEAGTVPLPPLPPNTFSNQAERAGHTAPTVTVILLDALNTPLAAQLYARQQVIKFLEQLRPNDRVALYALGNKLVVLHDFTAETATLLEALRRYRGKEVSELHASGDDSAASFSQSETQAALFGRVSGRMGNSGAGSEAALLAQWFDQAQALEQEFYTRERVRNTADALIAIANHLSGLPGRKNLIWVSGGFPIWNSLDRKLGIDGFRNAQDFQSDISRAARALNNVNLAIYPVNARGLGQGVYYRRPPRNIRELTDNRDSETGDAVVMDDLAKRSGGHAFYNTNDILGSIRRVVDDSNVTYVLAYSPRGVQWNGEFRKIKVQVRQRGVQLQYRNGYSALPEEKASDPSGGAAIATAIISQLDATGIGLTVQISADRGADSARKAPYLMRCEVDSHDVNFENQSGRWKTVLTLVTDELDPEGESLKAVSQTIELNLKPETYQSAITKGLFFDEQLPLPILPNAERLRVVIRDDATGRVGSVNIPLDQLSRPQLSSDH